MSASAVHFRPEEPAVFSDGVTLDTAEGVPGAAPSPDAEQHTCQRSPLNTAEEHKTEEESRLHLLTCGVLAGSRTDRILKVRNALVTKLQMIITSFVQKVSAVQIGLDHVLFGNSGCEEIHRQQRKTHLCEKSPSEQPFHTSADNKSLKGSKPDSEM